MPMIPGMLPPGMQQQPPYAPTINALHGDARLDPVAGGVEPPIIQLLRKMRGIEPMPHPGMPPVVPKLGGAIPKIGGIGAKVGAGAPKISAPGGGAKGLALGAALKPKKMKKIGASAKLPVGPRI